MGSADRMRKLSVARELLFLAATTEALRLAASHNTEPLRSRERLHRFAHAVHGGLVVLRERLHLVESVVMGMTNPALVLSASNEADISEDGPCILAEWSAEEIVERRDADRRGAKNRLEWAQRDHRPQTFVLHKNRDGKK